MRTRPKAIVLAVIIGVVTFAPIAAFAQQEQAQAATQVTVDLSELERSGQHEPSRKRATRDSSWQQESPRQAQAPSALACA